MMNNSEECVSPVNRAESVELISSDSSRPMSTDHNNTMARLEKVKADRLKRMSFTRESPVINTTSNGRPQSMKLETSSTSTRYEGLGSRPSSLRLSPRAGDFTVNSPRNDGSSNGSRSPVPQVNSPGLPMSPSNQSLAYTAASTPGVHHPLSNSSLNSTMPLMTPPHLQGHNDTLDSIELFLQSPEKQSPEKQNSFRSDVALASSTVDRHEDNRDGFEKALLLSASSANNVSNNSFDSDTHVAVVTPRIPSSYQLKRQGSYLSPSETAAAAALSAASAALAGQPAPPAAPPAQAALSPVFTRPKELPPTLSQEAMRVPSLSAQEFTQQLVTSPDLTMTMLEQVKADRLSRRTNTDPSITATLSRSQEDVTANQQQKYYALPQNGSSHSLAPSTDSSLELKRGGGGSGGSSVVIAAPVQLETVDMTPANLQSSIYLKTNKPSSSSNPNLLSTQKKLMSDLIDPPPVSVRISSTAPVKGASGSPQAEVSPSSVVSVGYTNIPSYHESSSTFISPMGNPLPSTQLRQHNPELNQKIIAAMIAMNEKLANQVKNSHHGVQVEERPLPRGNSGGYFNTKPASHLPDPRLREPTVFEEEHQQHQKHQQPQQHPIQRFPSNDSAENRHHQQKRTTSPLPGGARFIRRVSIDHLDEPNVVAAPSTFSSTAAARSQSPIRPGAAVSNYRTDLHLRSGAAGRDRERENSRSPVLSTQRDHSHSPPVAERRSLSPPVMRPSPPQTNPVTGKPLSYNDSVPLIPDRDLAKLMEMGLSEEEALKIYKEHVTMMLIPPDERATTGTSAMMNNAEIKRKRKILLRTHHHKKSTHRSGYNENAWGLHGEEASQVPDSRYGSRRGSRDLLSSHNHHYAGMRSRTSSEDLIGSAIRRNSHQEMFRASSQQRVRLGSSDISYSAPSPHPMVRRNSNGSTSFAAAPSPNPYAVRRGSNGSMSLQTSVRGTGGKVSRQGSLDLGTMSRRNSHNSSSMMIQERFRPGSVDVTQQMPLSRRGSHNSLSGGIHNHQTGRLKSGSIDLTLHNYPARRHSKEPVRRLSGDYGLGRIKMTKVNAAEIAANLLKTFESLAPLKELLTSANGAAAVVSAAPTEHRRSSVSTLFGDVDDSVDPAEDSSSSAERWRPALNEYLQQKSPVNTLQHSHHLHVNGGPVNISGVLYEGYDDTHGVHRMQTLSEESELS